MSIHTLRESGLPGVTMDYEEGGKVQVYRMNGRVVRVGPAATDEEIIAALRDQDKKDVDA
ncbi:hypothetical protein [Bradyrhizobium diazoefficiens]|uniref:hypothetical protein n=1 Tax=Bradyrhizobium diazoefficiens TaxID=1355477 RepID=UPI001B6B86F9|nr:hypothetical protein [Bradyrhizobium japonicum]